MSSAETGRMSDAVVVLAHWRTTAEAVSEVLSALDALTPLTKAEPGCRDFQVFQDADDPTSIVLVEHYADAAAQQAHVQSDHYRELIVEWVRPLLSERQVEMLRPYTGSDF
jgi:quinol monooxygenase YgiN